MVAEVIAKRLGSRIDSQLLVSDEEGAVLARNDDAHDVTAGLHTHQRTASRFPATRRAEFHPHPRKKTGDDVTTAVAAEDRMQAFLWRHLVPHEELLVEVNGEQQAGENARPLPPQSIMDAARERQHKKTKPEITFSQKQVAGRLRQLRQLRQLYDEGLLTAEFDADKVAECRTLEP